MLKLEKVPINARASFTILDRNMTAVITLIAPQDGGNPLDEAGLREVLENKRIVHGINEETLLSLANHPVYEQDFEIARGMPPENGQDGELKYLFETNVTLRPMEKEDGTVDYRELGLVQHVDAGAVLVEKILPTDGVDGVDVFGNPVKARRGKEPILPMGKNTRASEDGMQLLAEKSGHVELMGTRVVVQDTFTVAEDVNSATGNIKFNGNVVINGNVTAGFVVEATGNITVRKACEAATLIAGGHVTIGDGMNGGKLHTGGEVKSKYLQACEVFSGSNVYAGTVVNCNLRCGGSLLLSGNRGTIMGGFCSANKSIEAMYIGSANTYVPTRLEVGLDPVVQDRMQQAPRELEQTKQFLTSIDRAIDALSQLEAAGRLDGERLEQLHSAKYTRQIEQERVVALEKELAELSEKAKHVGFGTIVAKGRIFPGVRVTIGSFQMAVSDTLVRSKLQRGPDGIEVRTGF